MYRIRKEQGNLKIKQDFIYYRQIDKTSKDYMNLYNFHTVFAVYKLNSSVQITIYLENMLTLRKKSIHNYREKYGASNKCCRFFLLSFVQIENTLAPFLSIKYFFVSSYTSVIVLAGIVITIIIIIVTICYQQQWQHF